MGRAIQILRIIGALLCLLSVVLALTNPTGSGAKPDAPVALNVLLPWAIPAPLNQLIGILVPIAIAGMFWRSTATRERESPSWITITLLAVQTIFAFLVAEELQFVVAVEAGLLLATRTGALWVSAQALAAWLVAALHPELMAWIKPESITRAHFLEEIGLFMLVAILYNFLAFSLGLLASTEGRQRRALEIVNRELHAAQLGAAEAARVTERLRLARELHDAIGHQLSALSINLQIASRLSQDQARPHILESYELVGVLLSDVRAVVSANRLGDPAELSFALQQICSRIKTPEIHLDLEKIPVPVNEPLGHALFRCAQEVITNSLKHSGAAHLWIIMAIEDERLAMTIWDDGRGNPTLTVGNGLRGITERLHDLDGTCTFRNRPGAGFEVAVRAPFVKGTSA